MVKENKKKPKAVKENQVEGSLEQVEKVVPKLRVAKKGAHRGGKGSKA